MIILRCVLLFWTAVCVQSCGRADRPPDGGSVPPHRAATRASAAKGDSASPARALDEAHGTPGAEWTVSAAPIMTVGAALDDPDDQFQSVLGAALLPGGGIVVADLSGSLAVYDASGRFLRRVGRKGEGPGEFQTPWWVGVLGDSLMVWDQGLLRVSVFGLDGGLLRTAPFLEAQSMFPEVRGVMGDGSVVVDPGPDALAMAGMRAGVVRDSVTLSRFRPDGSRMGPIARVPGDQLYLFDRATGFGWRHVPFGSETYKVATRAGLYVGDGESGTVVLYDTAGTPLRTFRSPHERWEVTERDAARLRDGELVRIENVARRRESELSWEGVPIPDRAPALAGLRVDPDGHVWVRAEPRPGDPTEEWAVLAPDGTHAATVRVPAGLAVLEVGRDRVLGTRTGELGVGVVEVYRIEKGRK